MNMGLALWLIFEFVFFLVFYILKFLVRIFFLNFVFLKFLVRIFFLFCIFEKLRLYLSCIFFCKKTKIQHK